MSDRLYPNWEIEELYLENQSVWEEVLAGEMGITAALEYMHVEPNTVLWDAVVSHFIAGTTPL